MKSLFLLLSFDTFCRTSTIFFLAYEEVATAPKNHLDIWILHAIIYWTQSYCYKESRRDKRNFTDTTNKVVITGVCFSPLHSKY
jgi:hypothetical protein